MKTLHVVQPLYCFVISIVFFLFGYIAFGQTLTSDNGDYAPGETATLTGSGFQPGEDVEMVVQHADETPDTGAEHNPWMVVADSEGGFVTTWHVCEDDCEGELMKATADGQSSGLHAEVQFTDAQDEPPECIVISSSGSDTTILFPGVPVFTPPTAIDVCDSPVYIIVVSDDTIFGPFPVIYTRTICWTATDDAGNVSDTVCQTISVVTDTTIVPPIISCGSYTLPWWQVVDTTGAYAHTYTSALGLDSIVIIHVIIKPNYLIGSSVTACVSHTLPWGQTVNVSGDYSHTYTSVDGCDSILTIHVTISPSPSPTITGDTVVCSGSCSTFDAGSGYSSYAWSTGATTQTITVCTAGTYAVTVTNSNGCTGSTSRTLTVNPSPAPTITGCNVVCSGECSTFDAGSGYSSYAWSTGSITQTISVCTAGTYTVTVTNSNGCTGSASRTLTVNPNPTPAITGNNSICGGACTTLDAGAGYASYLWSTGATTQTISACTAGTYTVTVTNSYGCTGSASVCVTAQSNPTATASSNSPVSGGNTLYLYSSGGTSYYWTGPNGFVSTLQNPSISGVTYLNAGTYSVVVTNSYGCTATATTCVVVNCTGFKSHTVTQGGWGATPSGNNPAVYRNAYFALAFPTGLSMGCGANWLYLTTSLAVQNFLPSSGTPAPLTQIYIDPGSFLSNTLAGQITALALNVGFDNYDANFAPTSIHLRDLYVKSGPFMGWTVQQVLNEAQKKLGGCYSAYTASQLNTACTNINENYDGGNVDKGYLSCTPVRMATAPPGKEANILKLYPNPSNGLFVVELNLDEPVSNEVNVQVLDLFGQIAYENQTYVIDGMLREEVNLDNNLPSGNYLIRVSSGERIFSKQIIYQK